MPLCYKACRKSEAPNFSSSCNNEKVVSGLLRRNIKDLHVLCEGGDRILEWNKRIEGESWVGCWVPSTRVEITSWGYLSLRGWRRKSLTRLPIPFLTNLSRITRPFINWLPIHPSCNSDCRNFWIWLRLCNNTGLAYVCASYYAGESIDMLMNIFSMHNKQRERVPMLGRQIFRIRFFVSAALCALAALLSLRKIRVRPASG